MKKYIQLIGFSGMLVLLAACSDRQDGQPEETIDEGVRIENLMLEMESVSATKANHVSGYSVNYAADPTLVLMPQRQNWELFVQIYDDAIPYDYGKSYFTYDGTRYWTPVDLMWYPNYSRQEVRATLTYPGYTAPEADQSTAPLLLQQDQLVDRGYPNNILDPAHRLEIYMRHANAMLDFKLNGIDQSEIDNVTVIVGGTIYMPYQVVTTGANPEYMVIIPVGSSEPVVRVETVGGARYTQTTVTHIKSAAINTCYCFTLFGLDLELSEITVEEWVTGPGIGGEYTTTSSYPTMRGPADHPAILVYNNGLTQSITFNDQGEVTERPAGRTLVGIYIDGTETGRYVEIDPPIVLRNMVIDLNPYFE